jgi:ribonuclease P protein component
MPGSLPTPASLPKCERIRKRTEYLAVQGHGRKLASEHFLLFVLQRATPHAAAPAEVRGGFTVTRKVGGAVVRNRVKRRLREVFRRHKGWFPAGSEIVLVARPNAARLGYADVEREIGRLAARCAGPR